MPRESTQLKPFWWLVEESASEAGYLTMRLDTALDAPNYTLAEVAYWVEGRMLGALDGVRLAGDAAIEPLLAPALRQSDPGDVSAAAYLLASLDTPAATRTLEAALHEVRDDLTEPFARGLGRAGTVLALRALWARLQGAPARARAVVLRALAFVGATPDADWVELLRDDAPSLRQAAAAALRFAPRHALQRWVDYGASAPDPATRNRALQSGVAAGDPLAWQHCVSLVRSARPGAEELMPLVVMLGGQATQGVALDALTQPELARAALWALGFAGTCDAADACLATMRAGMHLQIAAEAFCAITGVDLAAQDLVEPTAPDRDALEAAEDDLEVDLEAEQDEDLPRPRVEGLARWWRENRARFVPGVRYLGGRPASAVCVCDALEHGPTRRRHALALELAARSSGAFTIETFALTPVQRAAQRRLAALPRNALRDGSRALGVAPLAVA